MFLLGFYERQTKHFQKDPPKLTGCGGQLACNHSNFPAMAASTQATAVEMQIVRKWFEDWDGNLRRKFLEKVVPLLTPHKLFAMTQNLTVTSPSAPFQCHCFQEKFAYFQQVLAKWTTNEANAFLSCLEDIDYPAMCHFYDLVASTAQEP